MDYQWYPGHMTKAKRSMQEDIKLVDLVIELLDARVVNASQNPDIDEMSRNKFRLILLNKSDLAEEKWNDEWILYFREKGFTARKVNSKDPGSVKSLQNVIREVCQDKIERDKKRGILNRPIRAMVVGIPNVGKSTFINSFAGKASAKTANKPGVTKGNQWIKLNRQLELLDTPGILWPKFEDQQVGVDLAIIGSIKDEILEPQELALDLIHFIRQEYPGALSKKYEIPETGTEYESLQKVAESQHCLTKGNELDLDKAAKRVLDDFRDGRLGRITLERPEQE